MKIENHRLILDGGKAAPFVASPNMGGSLDPEFLIMHFTAGRDAASSISWFKNPAAKASAHLVIGRDGAITQQVPFDRVAWHAGKSSWGELVGMNQYSIGIELDNAGKLTRKNGKWTAWFGGNYPDAEVIEATHRHDTASAGWHTFPEAQLAAAAEVASLLVSHYGLRDILGHDDISPKRKNDPGPAFPMASFKDKGESLAADREDFYAVTEPLNIRSGPGTQHGTVIPTMLPIGTLVIPLDRDGKWWHVDVEDTIEGTMDVQGWVHSGFLRPWLKPTESTTVDLRLRMGQEIVKFEARRDNKGRIAVYKLPSGDGGGTYEVAGINDRYHPQKVKELRDLIAAGKHAQAEETAAEYIATYTDRVDPWAEHAGVEFYLRDSAFNRGAGGAAKILQLAVGVKPDGAVGKITLEAAAAAEKNPAQMLLSLRNAREQYELTFIGKREKFWKGLTNRWNNALKVAQQLA